MIPGGSVDFEQLFNPRSIAVAGASNTAGKLGHDFIMRLGTSFRGTLSAINPREKSVAGTPAYASLGEVPNHVDLLITLIPGERLLDFIEACPSGKASFLAAIPSGFAECSADGGARQARLALLARERGMRLIGPNIVGILNCGLGLNASMMPTLPPGGRGLSCVTQSGGFGMALSMYALDRNIPVAKFCDVGNMADVQVHELIDYLAADHETAVIGLFLESIRSTDDTLASLSAAALRKPVVLTPVGLRTAGRRASTAHLGLHSDASNLFCSMTSQIHRAETALDLLNCANALLRQPPAKGQRAAIVTGTGGIGAEVADLCAANGLEVPLFSIGLQRQIGTLLPTYAAVQNPVDLTPIWREYPVVYPRVLDAIAKSNEVDVVVICITDVPTQFPDLAIALAGWLPQTRGGPSLVALWGARDQDCGGMKMLEEAGLPCFRSSRDTARAARALAGP